MRSVYQLVVRVIESEGLGSFVAVAVDSQLKRNLTKTQQTYAFRDRP
jgi:hypothetical protein